MIDASQIPEPSQDEIENLVKEGTTHKYYGRTCERARVMKAWYNAQEQELSGNNLSKSEIIRKSPIESSEDYQNRLNNLDLLPLEHKFFQTQQRIYDENNVQRTYPNDFWKNKEAHFDDCGDEIDVFFRDKVLFTKEIEGFGAICLDLAVKNGETVSIDGQAVPYPYIIQAHQLQYYDNWYGHLKLLITAVEKGNDTEYRAFTPTKIYVFKNKTATPQVYDHKFGKTPAYILKGAVDPQAGFKIGMPRRWNLTGLYLAASELFYDLKKGSALFGHPIPALPMKMIRQIAGAYNEEKDLFDASRIKDELGYVIAYPDDNPPSKLFYQADMQGLQHLRQVIFEDLINLIYQIAQVRDKSKIVHNASGRSKQFDSVEEQGLLAQTATDMEAIENEIFTMMANVRGEDPGKFKTVYSKHHDLSSADETWKHATEALQYGGAPRTTLKYLFTEYMRKRSAPKDFTDELATELAENGMPLTSVEINALKDRIDDGILILKTRPELGNETVLAHIKQELEHFQSEVLTTTNENE